MREHTCYSCEATSWQVKYKMPRFVPPVYYTFPGAALSKAQYTQLSSLINYIRQAASNLSKGDFDRFNERVEKLVEYLASGQANFPGLVERLGELHSKCATAKTMIATIAFPNIEQNIVRASLNVVMNFYFYRIYERAVMADLIYHLEQQRKTYMRSVKCSIVMLRKMIYTSVLPTVELAQNGVKRLLLVCGNRIIALHQEKDNQAAWIETLQETIYHLREEHAVAHEKAEARERDLQVKLEIAQSQSYADVMTVVERYNNERLNEVAALTDYNAALQQELQNAKAQYQIDKSDFAAQKAAYYRQIDKGNQQIVQQQAYIEELATRIAVQQGQLLDMETKQAVAAANLEHEIAEQKAALSLMQQEHAMAIEQRYVLVNQQDAALAEQKMLVDQLEHEIAYFKRQVADDAVLFTKYDHERGYALASISQLESQLLASERACESQAELARLQQQYDEHVFQLDYELKLLQETHERAQIEGLSHENELYMRVNELEIELKQYAQRTYRAQQLESELRARLRAHENSQLMAWQTLHQAEEALAASMAGSLDIVTARMSACGTKATALSSEIVKISALVCKDPGRKDLYLETAEYAKMQQHQIDILQAQLLQCQRAAAALSDQMEHNYANITAAYVQMDALNAALTALHDEQKDRDEQMQQQIIGHEKEKQAMQAHISSLHSAQLAQKQAFELYLSRETARTDDLECHIVLLTSEKAELELGLNAAKEKLAYLSSSYDALQVEDTRQIQRLEKEHAQLEAYIADLHAKLDESRTLYQNIQSSAEKAQGDCELERQALLQQKTALEKQISLTENELRENQLNQRLVVEQSQRELGIYAKQLESQEVRLLLAEKSNSKLRQQNETITYTLKSHIMPEIIITKQKIGLIATLNNKIHNFQLPFGQITALVNDSFRQSKILHMFELKYVNVHLAYKETERQQQLHANAMLQEKLIASYKENLRMKNGVCKLETLFKEEITHIQIDLTQTKNYVQQEIVREQQRDARETMKKLLQKEVMQLKTQRNQEMLNQKVQMLSKLTREAKGQLE